MERSCTRTLTLIMLPWLFYPAGVQVDIPSIQASQIRRALFSAPTLEDHDIDQSEQDCPWEYPDRSSQPRDRADTCKKQ